MEQLSSGMQIVHRGCRTGSAEQRVQSKERRAEGSIHDAAGIGERAGIGGIAQALRCIKGIKGIKGYMKYKGPERE